MDTPYLLFSHFGFSTHCISMDNLLPPRPLAVLRSLIDAVDAKLVQLFNERAKLVLEVGQRKAADGTPVYAPHREQAVLTRVLAANTGPLLNVTLEAIYREIMSGSFALERPLRIGYLGPPGSFSHEAAAKQFGRSVTYENLRTIDGVFEEVSRGHVDYGLVPVENASIGSVAETLEGFLTHAGRVAVCAEVQLSVAQALITVPGAVPSDIKVIMSKPEALAQCRRWLATQYPNATLVPAASTSAAVESVAKEFAERGADARGTAAVGSKLAASLSDLPIMFPEIQDVTPNVTRFVVLCSSSTAAAVSAPSGTDKTSLLFVCRDHPGALRDILDAFARADVNLTHIDKRPCPPPTLAHLISISSAGTGLAAGILAGSGLSAATALDVDPPAILDGAATNGTAPNGTASSPSQPFIGGEQWTDASARAGSPLQHHDGEGLAPSLMVPALTGGRGSTTLPFVYAFFVEASGHITTPSMQTALREAAEHCVCLKVMGSFPTARRVL